MLFLMCRVGSERFAVPTREVIEVVPRLKLHSLVGMPAWAAGLFAYRGRPIVVVDLSCLVNGQTCPKRWSNRIIIVEATISSEPATIGLLVEHLVPLHRDLPPFEPGTTTDTWGRILMDDRGIYRVLDMNALLQSRQFVDFFAAESRA
jgi:chemotaxis-related protein WspB